MPRKAVILLSGGLDSVTCLAIARAQKFECYTLNFDYGQKHTAELKAAEEISKRYGAVKHVVVQLGLGQLGGSAITDANIAVPDYDGSTEIPATYVPARNTVFLSIALGWAEILNAHDIFIGVSSVDYSGYPDCRAEYIAAFQNMADLATKTGVEGHPIRIQAPLLYLSKAATIHEGLRLGVDYAMTVSCYRADLNGRACGSCASCEFRKKGFNEAGVTDPTHYASNYA
jgi:7-cyano-7-deazaguanine synthase